MTDSTPIPRWLLPPGHDEDERPVAPAAASPFSPPPDSEGMNDARATWAARAVDAFQQTTGTDDEDVLSDLLTDLMHWADRNRYDFEAAFIRARGNYHAETLGDGG